MADYLAASGTIHTPRVSIILVKSMVIVKWMVLTVAVGLLLWAGWKYPTLSGKVAYFSLDKRVRIEVNGATVPGDLLRGIYAGVLTRRDPGHEHSYYLVYAGDTDFTGHVGAVLDCHRWVAPRLPFLFETATYPPCPWTAGDGLHRSDWTLMEKDGGNMEFTTADHTVIRMRISR